MGRVIKKGNGIINKAATNFRRNLYKEEDKKRLDKEGLEKFKKSQDLLNNFIPQKKLLRN